MASINGDQISIDSRDNGKTVPTGILSSFTAVSAKWNDASISPAGTLTFTVDGEAGENNVMDLGAGQRTIMCNTPLAFVDVAVTGLPAGAVVTLYLR